MLSSEFNLLTFVIMESDCIKYSEIKFLPTLIQDYLEDSVKLDELFAYAPDLKGFKNAIKRRGFPQSSRDVLVGELIEQYHNLKNCDKQIELINSLSESNTFTVTTGHQICLFTGPLYFIYKILSVVKLSEQLRKEFPENNFVPIYWMATEDHDFLEVNHFNSNGKKYEKSGENTQAVGPMKPDLEPMLSQIKKDFGKGKNADFLIQLFKQAYRHESLSEATRYLVHELLGEFGIVIIDPNNAALKKLFLPQIKKELKERVALSEVNQSILKMQELGYKVQVNPREINLFYLQSDSRKRIVKREEDYALADDSISWETKKLMLEIEEFPERFSPNVLLRPVYQECILPNLSYTGGAGELSYWFEMKGMFDEFNIDFPILLLRNSAIITSGSFRRKLAKNDLAIKDLFEDIDLLEDKLISLKSEKILSLKKEEEKIVELFEEIKTRAGAIDFTLIQSADAEKTKALKTLHRLEKKFKRGEKRNYQLQVRQLHELVDVVFPNGIFQERFTNFSEIVLNNGLDFIDLLYDEFDPLNPDITVIGLD